MTLGQKQWLVGKLETQALYGTAVTVLSSSSGWSHIVVPSQPTPRDRRGYPGWIPTWQLSAKAPKSTSALAVVTSKTAWVLRSPSSAATADRIMEVSYDTRLPVVASNSSSIEVSLLDGRRGYLRRSVASIRSATASWSASHAQVVVEARKFLGLSYLWGGTSGFGFDCSGFSYSVLHVLGRTIPRDAAPQSLKGAPVSRRDLRPGDLVFLRDSSGVVVHVAIYDGAPGGVPSVIHAPGTGMPIEITPLSAWPSSSYAGARRYL